MAAYERSLALDPGYAPAWAGLAWSLDNLSEEEPDLDRLLAMKRRASEAADRAVVLALRRDAPTTREAGCEPATGTSRWLRLADLENAIKLNGSDGAVYRVVRILAALGRVPEAISSLKRATELEPLSAVGWVILGRLYNGSGQFDQARSAFRKVLEVAPDYDTIQCRLGDVLLLEGRPAEALLAAGACRADMWRLTLTAMSEHSLGHKEESSKALGTLIERNSTFCRLPDRGGISMARRERQRLRVARTGRCADGWWADGPPVLPVPAVDSRRPALEVLLEEAELPGGMSIAARGRLTGHRLLNDRQVIPTAETRAVSKTPKNFPGRGVGRGSIPEGRGVFSGYGTSVTGTPVPSHQAASKIR